MIVTLRALALVLLVAATAYAIERWTLHPLRCTYAASTGAALLDDADPADYRTRRAAHQLRVELEACQCVSPPDVGILMARAAAAEDDGDRTAAIAEYQNALRIDRRPEIYFRLGLLQHETGNGNDALNNLVRACAFNPALLADIPDDALRLETRNRVRAAYGEDWIP
jgi:tetratricopeptide (TPR) repeat protein